MFRIYKESLWHRITRNIFRFYFFLFLYKNILYFKHVWLHLKERKGIHLNGFSSIFIPPIPSIVYIPFQFLRKKYFIIADLLLLLFFFFLAMEYEINNNNTKMCEFMNTFFPRRLIRIRNKCLSINFIDKYR